MSWFVLKLTCSLRPRTIEAVGRARTLPKRSPSFLLAIVPDPVASGLVDSLARPGGNITGFTTVAADLAGKRLELLKETVPNLSRVAVLWDPQNPAAVRNSGRKANNRHETWVCNFIRWRSAAPTNSKACSRRRPRRAALRSIVTQHTLATSHQRTDRQTWRPKIGCPRCILAEILSNGGGLMSYGSRPQAEPYTRAASIVDKILKGTKPADLRSSSRRSSSSSSI